MDVPPLDCFADGGGCDLKGERVTDTELDAAILQAHAASDAEQLARLYLDASKRKQAQGDEEAQVFLMVQAYVFALECGSPIAEQLYSSLKAYGREA